MEDGFLQEESIMQFELNEKQKTEFVLGIHNELEPWDQDLTHSMALAEHLELSDEHMNVLRYLRRSYKRHGRIQHAHSLSQALATRYASKGGLKYLYTLFPKGPLAQGCRLAGIPAPRDSINSSFGTVT